VAAEFVALADLLRAPAACGAETSTRSADEASATQARRQFASQTAASESDRRSEVDAPDVVQDTLRAALRDARLFRARLADAFDDSAARLLRELAADVLARELRLAPCDLAVIVQRAAERVPVVRVRVAPGDVACAAHVSLARLGDGSVSGIPVIADAALGAGDAIVELADGALDVRLGVRLAAVLEAFA
jgi:flagellar biosynthesis/type III secretory pathway protein FliH